MTAPQLGTLTWAPAADRTDLLAAVAVVLVVVAAQTLAIVRLRRRPGPA